jgi:uncharacterized membrane protein
VAKPSERSDSNLLIAVGIILFISCVCSLYTAFVVKGVLNAFASSQTMALIITDAGVKSDDANLERQLSSATAALKMSADISYALVVASLMMGLALVWRVLAKKENG